MIEIADTGSGKTHRDENFPVASVLIAPGFRAPIMAFYDFVRAADDISDHPTLPPHEKLDLLDRLEEGLTSAPGARDAEPVAQFRRGDVTVIRGAEGGEELRVEAHRASRKT